MEDDYLAEAISLSSGVTCPPGVIPTENLNIRFAGIKISGINYTYLT